MRYSRHERHRRYKRYERHDPAPVVPTVTIKAKSSVPTFTVGDADKAASEFFDITPANAAVTLKIVTGTHATVVANKLHAVDGGDVDVSCTSVDFPTVTDTVTIGITAAP